MFCRCCCCLTYQPNLVSLGEKNRSIDNHKLPNYLMVTEKHHKETLSCCSGFHAERCTQNNAGHLVIYPVSPSGTASYLLRIAWSYVGSETGGDSFVFRGTIFVGRDSSPGVDVPLHTTTPHHHPTPHPPPPSHMVTGFSDSFHVFPMCLLTNLQLILDTEPVGVLNYPPSSLLIQMKMFPVPF